MKAVTVSYRRLVSDGGYCNRALEVTLELEDGDTYAKGLATVKKLVDQGLRRTQELEIREATLGFNRDIIAREEAALARQVQEADSLRQTIVDHEAQAAKDRQRLEDLETEDLPF